MSDSTGWQSRRWWHAAFACGLAFALFAARSQVRSRAGLDDTYYLLQTSSLVEDGDLDLRNDILASGFSLGSRLDVLTTTTRDGTLANNFSIGPSVLWMPPYVAGMPLRRTASGQEAVRWSTGQRAALHLFSLLALAGVTFFLLRFYGVIASDASLGLLPTLAMVLGTPLLVYATTDYTMSHLASAAATSLFIGAALQLERRPSRGAAFFAGVALSLVFLMRWQDIVFAALLVPALLGRKTMRAAVALFGWLVLGFLPAATLQLHAWHAERGSWFVMPQGSAFFHWTDPSIGGLLLSARSGLLTWSPVFALAVCGLLLPWKATISRRWAFAALLVIAAEIYVNAAAGDWWGGHSFGARRMTSCVLLLPLGLANLNAFVPRFAKVALVFCCCYGLFVGHLYWNGIQDLSLVFRGAPSEIGETANNLPGVVQDPVEARMRLRDMSLPAPADYLHSPGASPSSAGIAATWLIVLGFLLVCALLAARISSRRLVAAMLGTYFVIAVAAHARLATGPARDAAERDRWRELAMQWQLHPRQFAADAMSLEGMPATRADAYRYLQLFFEWRVGDPAVAHGILDSLARRGYPAALETRSSVHAAESKGRSLIRWIPTTFLQVVRDRPSADVSFPDSTSAAGKEWTIAFDLASGDLPPDTSNAIAYLVGEGNKALADLEGRVGRVALVTPRTTSEIGFGIEAHDDYAVQMVFSLSPPAATAHLAKGPVVSPELRAAPAVALGAPTDLIVGRFGSSGLPAPHGAAFSNLVVVVR